MHNTHTHTHSTVQTLGRCCSLLCAPSLHLFDQKYIKNSNIGYQQQVCFFVKLFLIFFSGFFDE